MNLSVAREHVMAATTPPQTAIDRPWNGTTEDCDACRAETPHEVTIEIRAESPDPENAGCSREPYRIATCHLCGDETVLRMNNA